MPGQVEPSGDCDYANWRACAYTGRPIIYFSAYFLLMLRKNIYLQQTAHEKTDNKKYNHAHLNMCKGSIFPTRYSLISCLPIYGEKNK
ncbi:hypothetical protein DT73_00100 [Mangrovibacter sp. MFB070]|nr:hypothetical protein DT73_00100 [Mangrovibacter sp. MFB070]